MSEGTRKFTRAIPSTGRTHIAATDSPPSGTRCSFKQSFIEERQGSSCHSRSSAARLVLQATPFARTACRSTYAIQRVAGNTTYTCRLAPRKGRQARRACYPFPDVQPARSGCTRLEVPPFGYSRLKTAVERGVPLEIAPHTCTRAPHTGQKYIMVRVGGSSIRPRTVTTR